RGILAFLAHHLPDPFLELRLCQVVVIDPAFVARVVRRVDIDTFDPARVCREQAFKRDQIIALNDEVCRPARVFSPVKASRRSPAYGAAPPGGSFQWPSCP